MSKYDAYRGSQAFIWGRTGAASRGLAARGSIGRPHEDRVEELVDRPAVLGPAAAQPPLTDVARLLQDATRGRVPLEDAGVDPRQVVHAEGVRRQSPHRLRRDPPPPERLAQPVPDLRRSSVHVFLDVEPDPP